MDVEEIMNITTMDWQEVLLRVGIAMLFGLILGIDRDSKNKPIEFRAYMIVALTTCIVAILGQEIYANFANAENVVSLDLGKIISGTLTGLGFLGAGAIIKVEDKKIVGSATGASIWAAGIMGLTIGFGFYALAVICFAAIALILIGGGFCMKHFQGKDDKEDVKD